MMKQKKRSDAQIAAVSDMTSGPIFQHLLWFSLPLLAGDLFQQLYNSVDAWVVGNYVSNEAFSAVGSVAPILNLLIGFFIGLSNGAGVVIAQHFGAGQESEVRSAVHTAVAMTLVLGLIFTVAGQGMIPFLLKLMNTPASVWSDSESYLRICFLGVLGLMLYNIGAAILQAIGNSRLPFLYLAACAVTNVVLDFVFVVVFGAGIQGVAYATILSQALSAFLVVRTLVRTDSWVQLRLADLNLQRTQLRNILRLGLPAALQMAVTAFSNVFVQSYINFFGPDCMSGWTAYSKVDQVLLLPIKSLALATTTFVGQNVGRGQLQRAKKGVRTAWVMCEACTALLVLLVTLIAPYLVAFFNPRPAVIEYGSMFLRCLSPFYLFAVLNHIIPGALRGTGNSRTPMMITLISYVGLRQMYLYVMAHHISNTILPISMGYPFGWVTCALFLLIYYRVKGLQSHSVVREI